MGHGVTGELMENEESASKAEVGVLYLFDLYSIDNPKIRRAPSAPNRASQIPQSELERFPPNNIGWVSLCIPVVC